MPSEQTYHAPQSNRVKLVVASSVMLTFISFWRAAAVVLNDLGSSAFYAGGIAEAAIGKSAPWFILGVMLFSFAVRAVYVESCSMFTRGGVYRVVKEALGGTFAKVSVSALMFDYILTGPISGVSAGQYIVGLLNELLQVCARNGYLPDTLMDSHHAAILLPVNGASAVLAIAVTVYYWWLNIKGIEESSEKALSVMKITTVMVVILLGWGFYTAWVRHASLPPFPTPENLHFSMPALGFLQGTKLASMFGLFGILMAFGHSVLAMSGEETLAQVNREIAHPKLKNLKRAAIVIAIYSFVFTGIASLLAVMIIPDSVRVPVYNQNLIAGLAMYMVGPLSLRIIFRIFVVVVGFLILSGAINASIIGSTGVLMRVAEDGVLTDWFRKPHKRFGTSYRIVNLVTALQLFTIVVSGGNMDMLGEAYAFGVIWSFTFNSLAMLVLLPEGDGATQLTAPSSEGATSKPVKVKTAKPKTEKAKTTKSDVATLEVKKPKTTKRKATTPKVARPTITKSAPEKPKVATPKVVKTESPKSATPKVETPKTQPAVNTPKTVKPKGAKPRTARAPKKDPSE